MKLENKITILFISLALISLSGCKIKSEKTEVCGLTEEMCHSANKKLDTAICLCVETGEGAKNLKEISCGAGQHVYENECEEDSLQNCGEHGNDCTKKIEAWAAGGCLNSTCETTACTTGFHVFNHACEEDSLLHCGSHGNDCSLAISNMKFGTCDNGQCVAIECQNNYHLAENNCVLNYSKGETFNFGHYEQDNDASNGTEPITWRVLDVQDGKYLVISEKTLDVKPYNTEDREITWEKSTIRSWLNGYDVTYNTEGIDYSRDNFIDAAFTAEEQAKIVASDVPAHPTPRYSTPVGNATTDKIFFLSITEAENYFSSDEDRRADATPYAVKQGAWVEGSESGDYTHNGTCTDIHCYSHWWLRSPGTYNDYAASVNNVGSFGNYGCNVDDDSVAVRPALWVNL